MKKKSRAKAIVRWEAYAPPTAPHVRGRFTPVTRDEDGIPEESRVEARCFGCETPFKRTCSSGEPQKHIDVFARVHADCHAAPKVRAKWSTDRTPEEQLALESLVPMWTSAVTPRTIPAPDGRGAITVGFRHLGRSDGPDVPSDVMTPQRCSDLLAMLVKDLAAIHGVSKERLNWLARQIIMIVVPGQVNRIPVQAFLEGKW